MEYRFTWKRLAWPIQIAVWLFSFYIAWNLVPAGYTKLLQDPGQVSYFTALGLPMTVLIAVGIVESLGSLLMFIPRVSFYGSFSVFVVMLFASYFNNGMINTLTLAFLALVVSILTRPGLFRKKPVITKISI